MRENVYTAVADVIHQSQDVRAIQVGFHNEQTQWSVALGQVDGGHSGREVTIEDTFLFGSGTKPYTATAVMQLVESGRVHLSDTLASHIDALLLQQHNTTLVKMFGPPAAYITIENLLQMRSGLSDWDFLGFDYKLLKSQDQKMPKSWTPYELLDTVGDRKIIIESPSAGGGKNESCRFLCMPGE